MDQVRINFSTPTISTTSLHKSSSNLNSTTNHNRINAFQNPSPTNSSTNLIPSGTTLVTPHSPYVKRTGWFGGKRGVSVMSGDHPSMKEILHPLSLKFADKRLEDEWDVSNLDRFSKQQRIGLAVANAAVVASAAFDGVSRGMTQINTRNDIAMCCLLFVCNVLLLFKSLRSRHLQLILSVTLLLWSILQSLNVLNVLTNGFVEYSNSLACLIVMASGSSVRIKYRYSVICASITYVFVLTLMSWAFSPHYPWYTNFCFSLNMLGAAFSVIVVGYFIELFMKRSQLLRHVVRIETQKSKEQEIIDTQLLENIFPHQISATLKEFAVEQQTAHLQNLRRGGGGSMGTSETTTPGAKQLVVCHSYESVTIVLVDIVGFTTWSSTVAPQTLVSSLNEIFSTFDDIVERHGFEKVKTLGDAYLCVGNMSVPVVNHQQKAVDMALEMIAFMETGTHTELHSVHVGISCGPLIAGVTGASKWNYDIFGKTLAHVMLTESACPSNNIVVTHPVYEKLHKLDKFAVKQLEPMTDYENVKFGVHLLTPKKSGDRRASVESVESIPSSRPRSKKQIARSFKPVLPDVNDDDVASGLVGTEYYQHLLRQATGKSKYKVKSTITLNDIANMNGNEALLDAYRVELNTFKKKFFRMKFGSRLPFLENDFLSDMRKKTLAYSFRLFVVYITVFVFWLLMDLFSAVLPMQELNPYIWVLQGVNLFLFIVLLILSKTRYFSHVATNIFTFGVLLFGGICWVGCLILENRVVYHYHRPLLYTFMLYLFVYFNIKRIIILSMSTTIAGILVTNLFPPPSGHGLTVMLAYIVANFVAFLANLCLEQESRTQFILLKITKFELQHQQQGQENVKLLLNNILPEQICKRLISDESSVIVDYFADATMMFVTISNFTALNVGLSPLQTFAVLNQIFTVFDNMVKDAGLEKIKSINATYMVASGIPTTRSDHQRVMVKLGLSMISAMNNITLPWVPQGVSPVLRIGVASGPVVAGIIGLKKYCYDCWSDTTNTAARMESLGVEGHIHVTKPVYEALNNEYTFLQRGVLEVKGKGKMETYLLSASSQPVRITRFTAHSNYGDDDFV